MAKKDKEPLKLLNEASPEVVFHTGNEEDVAGTQMLSAQHVSNRRSLIWCCGCSGAVVVASGIVVLILSLTLFKLKDATLTMNSLSLDGFSVNLGTIARPAVSINATLIADISIENPNVASFRFHESTTDFFYGGETVGVAYAPSGKVAAHRTERMDVKVEVLIDRVAERMNVTADFFRSGYAEMNLTSFTDITGKISVIGIFKREMELVMNCSLTLEVSIEKQEITRTECLATVN